MQQPSLQDQPSPASPRRPLDIADFQLQGEPSSELNSLLGTKHLLEASKHLENMHKVIAEAEQQVVAYMRQMPDDSMPDHLTIYRMTEVAGPIKRMPLQLATVLADTIILAADQVDTFEKGVRHRAILGITQGLLTQAGREDTLEDASERLITGLLALMERRGVEPKNPWHRVSLHARRLVLRDVVDFEEGTSESKGGLSEGW
jgi:hypothetical protein